MGKNDKVPAYISAMIGAAYAIMLGFAIWFLWG